MATNKDALLKSLHQNKQQFEPDQPKELDSGPEIKGQSKLWTLRCLL